MGMETPYISLLLEFHTHFQEQIMYLYHLYLSVLTRLHIAIYSVLDEFHIQADMRGYWIGECMCICIYVRKSETVCTL
jgi:hypothetical protein